MGKGTRRDKETGESFNPMTMRDNREYPYNAVGAAIDFVLTRGKDIKDYGDFGEKFLRESKHFYICFHALLTNMVKNNELNSDLKNVTKPAMAKIEDFAKESIEARLASIKVDENIKRVETRIEKIFADRRKELAEKRRKADTFFDGI
eukprot:TRINITY_DN7479_c0_g5_i1.p1 TRINITY_DN7479_c0_g5~~TRINITY_DN7479_c0_g5_i1.p1  ORF type:complete len:148 (+),score=37.52 TRINITY_DN7479_c0_g5_i1:116-559(+)